MRDAKTVGSALLIAWLAALGAPAFAVDHAAAVRAANVWREDVPGDDIRHDARASRVQVADLDGDGADEIVYLGSATCVQAGFDCDNEIHVMTALAHDDPRIRPGPLDNADRRDFWRRARATGYADAASFHVPGDVERIAVAGGRIEVTFAARLDAQACKRSLRDADLRIARADPCPQPGRHAWTLQWRAGHLALARKRMLRVQ